MELAAALASAGLPEGTPAGIATVNGDGRVSCAAVGAWPNGKPVTPADPFYVASLAKQVTGATLALLVRDGKLDPDAPIARYLTGFPDWSRTIIARQLAHHTAGLSGPALEARIRGDWTTEAVLAALRTTTGSRAAGFTYSNAGYILLAELIAAVAGQSFASFVADRFGLDFAVDPAFPQVALLGSKLPLSHGDGGLWTTVADFAAWLHRQNQDQFGIEALVTSPGAGAADYGWGLGIGTFRGSALYRHGGQWRGASAMAARCPALGIGVVAVAAQDEIGPLDALVDTVLNAMWTANGPYVQPAGSIDDTV